MMLLRPLLGALPALLLAAVPSTAQQVLPTHADIVFATVPVSGGGTVDLKLDLYLPSGTTQPAPTVIWIHGGGWQFGSKFPTIAAPLTLDGYAVASIEYRLSGEAPWPAQIHDCKAAIRWLRANALTYGLDPERFGVAGTSAGGHLASFVGTSAGENSISIGERTLDVEGDVGGNLDESSRVQAVVDYFGPTNFLRMSLAPASEDKDSPNSSESKLITGGTVSVQLVPEDVLAADPAQLLSGDDPPFRIVQGTADMTVPFDQSEYLWRAAREVHGLDWELISVPDGPHGGPAYPIGYARDFFDVALAPRPTTVRVEALADATEGGAPGAVRVARTGALDTELVVRLDVGGSDAVDRATPGRDHTPLPQLVVLAPGVAQRTLQVAAVQDALVEGPEVVRVGIVPDPAYHVAHDGAVARLTAVDDEDASGLPQVVVKTLDDVATEGSTDEGLVRFMRSSTAGPLTVRYLLRGTVEPAADVALASGAVTFAAGQAWVDLAVQTLDDQLVEPAEVWAIELLPGPDHSLTDARVASGRLVDDDREASPIRLGILSERPTAAEGEPLVFVVTRTGNAFLPVSVQLSLSGTAQAGSDLGGSFATANFAAGSNYARVTLDALPDGLAEGTERVELSVVPAPFVRAIDGSTRGGVVLDSNVPPIVGTPVRQVLGEATLGQPFALDLHTEPGALCVTYYALGTGYVPLLGQPVLLDVASAAYLFGGATAADGTLRFFEPAPSDPTLVGTSLFFQSFALVPSGGVAVSEAEGRRVGLLE